MAILRIDGRPLHYEVTGPGGAPAIVLSNSLGTTLSMWDAQVSTLSARHRLIRYDTRGHGGSPAMTAGARLTLDGLADDIAALLDHLGIARAHVAGLSLGGMAAQAMAARHPERVESLVLMATAAHMGARDAWYARAALVREKGLEAIADAVVERWFTQHLRATDPALAAAYRRRLLAIDPEGYAACAEAIGDMDLRASNGRITAPTLILPGEDDPATPVSMSEDIQRQIKGAELIVIPKAAHLLAVEAPAAVNAALGAWLSRF
ncbi:3-oxoadipate enol-lactonase [Bosea sp. (in: a-proteobacteria)]|uniref:3-oxoadipate enol-lactonase n=1 Tax=Bosea sp. (in: a-proteobacteria) TaxID=1871050 RepID=UPI0026054234|nr:3-oxoadipate enol-lactonase [Bosea sp. (in: a-proteobacteria)]MCO5091213.1 3-oxoadipate enol-lactonase [Bosea sp. (in: a-proteobacteria)]